MATRDRLVPRESDRRALTGKNKEDNYPAANIEDSNRVDGD